MIARIRGKIIEHDGQFVVVDCGGVGYGVQVCHDEQQQLAIGVTSDLYIAEQIKEDHHDLYGFRDKSRKGLFTLLISVNGVGPKAAMAILNIGSEGQVRTAIAGGDTKFIIAAQGVGKRVAERVIVDLKNKVGLEAAEDATGFLQDSVINDEATEALVALGHSPQDAVQLLKHVDKDLSTNERIKQALRSVNR